MLFGRSKSKPRRFPEGFSKSMISNPTPIDAININGDYIDLVQNPQTERHHLLPAHPLSPPAAKTKSNHSAAPNVGPRQAMSGAAKEEARLPEGPRNKSTLSDDQGKHGIHGNHSGVPLPATGSTTPRQLGARSPPASASAAAGTSNSHFKPSTPTTSPTSALARLQNYHIDEPSEPTPTGTNFSRKITASPESTNASSIVSSNISPRTPKPVPAKKRRDHHEHSNPTIQTIEASPCRPAVPELSRPPSRGRRRDRLSDSQKRTSTISPLRRRSATPTDKSYEAHNVTEDKRTPPAQSQKKEQSRERGSGRNTPQLHSGRNTPGGLHSGRNTPQSHGRLTPEIEQSGRLQVCPDVSRSSSVYSGDQSSREDLTQELQAAPPRAKTPTEIPPPSPYLPYRPPTAALPALPSSAQANEKQKSPLQLPPLSTFSKSLEPEEPIRPQLPPLDIISPVDGDLSRLFPTTSADMPSRIQDAVISGPISPQGTKLPSYLGPLQDVQTSNPITPSSPVERLQAKHHQGLGRKVSTRLRGLIGGKHRPIPDRHTPSPESPRYRLANAVISEPVPIPEEEQKRDPEIERLKMRFDLEAQSQQRALAEAEAEERRLEKQLEQIKRVDQQRTERRRMGEERAASQRHKEYPDHPEKRVHSKVNDWHYSPSASTSKSSLVSASEGPSAASDPSDPGLSSHRSSLSRIGAESTISPITPADDFSFSVLSAVETSKSGSTMRPGGPPSTIGKRSLEVPVFLCQDTENVDSMPQDPPTPNAREIEDARNSFMTSELEKQLEGGAVNRAFENARTQDLFLRPIEKASSDTGPSGKAKPDIAVRTGLDNAFDTLSGSPLPSPITPLDPMRKSIRPPGKPFAGGPKLLRSATMSSRPGAGKLHPKPSGAPIAESAPGTPLTSSLNPPKAPTRPGMVRSKTMNPSLEAGFRSPPRRQNTIAIHPTADSAPSSRAPSRAQLTPEPLQEVEELYNEAAAYERRHGPAIFSFAPSLALDGPPSSVFPEDSISNVGGRNTYLASAPTSPMGRGGPEPILPLPPVPTEIPKAPTHVPSETDWQPQLRPAKSLAELTKSPQNNRVAALGGGLRVNTDVSSNLAVPASEPGRSGTVKRSKSYGGGLRRAFSRRVAPSQDPPSPPPVASPAIERMPQLLSGLSSVPGSPLEEPAADKPKSGTLVVGDKHLRPSKGAVKCTYCHRGPFANMWVAVDEQMFAVCRMCCNEMVSEQKAELF